MDVASNLLAGFENALGPQTFLLALVGVTVGTMVGVLPGLGPASTMALLLPLTLHFDPVDAFVLFAGIYYGGMYGGSTTAILLNVPGETSSVPTTLEGHPMALRGRGGQALATAAIGSFVAGTISTVAISFLAPAMASVAKSIQPAEYFAIVVLAFVTVSALIGDSVVRGLASLSVGLSIGLIGIDPLTGQARYTFDVPQLYDGLRLVSIAVGLFAISEALSVASRLRERRARVATIEGRVRMSRSDVSRSWRPWLRGTALGLPIGALPAGGAEIPTFLSYSVERRLARRPGRTDEFGNGAIEGVAGPEAANNAAFSGVLVPLLTLGIPTSATAGVMLVAFQMYNIQPGPQLFENEPLLVWTLLASLYIGNVMLLALNLPLVRVWVKLLALPTAILTALILVFAILGVYSETGDVFEIGVAVTFGVLGLLMRRSGFPVAPLIVGALLGPMLESHFRRAIALSGGDTLVFVTRPISATILAIAALSLLAPMVLRRISGYSPVDQD